MSHQQTARGNRDNGKPIVVCYSHRDRRFVDRLLVHLRPLERQGLIEVCVDGKLEPGQHWRHYLQTSMRRGCIAVILVSADLYSSRFILEEEVPILLAREGRKRTRIIPLICGPSRFATDQLGDYQPANDPDHPLSSLPYSRREVIFARVAELIEAKLDSTLTNVRRVQSRPSERRRAAGNY